MRNGIDWYLDMLKDLHPDPCTTCDVAGQCDTRELLIGIQKLLIGMEIRLERIRTDLGADNA
jgi:NADH dehydrogenase/NADH:ubiquinone oxidoreductase subunit G